MNQLDANKALFSSTLKFHNHEEYVNYCTDTVKTFLQQNKVIITYLRNSYSCPTCQGPHKGRKIGVLVAVRTTSELEPSVGWSLCSKRDTFNKYVGLFKALVRVFADEETELDIPRSVFENPAAIVFLDRVCAYFHLEPELETTNEPYEAVKGE